MNKIIKHIREPIEIFSLIVKHEPKYLLIFLPQVLLSSVLPFFHIYMPKLIIERLVNKSPYSAVITMVLIYCLVILFINIINDILCTKTSMCNASFDRKMRLELGKTVANLPVNDIEGAAMQDSIRLAQNSGNLTMVADIVKKMLQCVITVIGLTFILVRLNILFFLVISVILSCKILFTRIEYRYIKKMRILTAQNDKEGEYINQVCYFNPGGAKEIRTNNLQNWFLSKVKKYRGRMVKLQMDSFLRKMFFDGLNIVIMGVFSFVVLKLLSARYIEEGLAIADFTMYFAAITTLVTTLLSFADLIGDYNQQLVKVADYKKLTCKLVEQQLDMDVSGIKICDFNEIKFEGVYFAYPNTDNYVLKNINISISAKEKLVVVGLNGAGKSTFIKLLCKFYKPTEGTIMLNGIDIWKIPNTVYYKFISAVFQDFSTFAFTALENITLKEDKGDIEDIIKDVRLTDHIVRLPRGIDTYLSKEFSSEGVELSGGQKQKIAIARALYKDAPLIILDEPTASLDPKAESEIYTDLFNISKNKTAIFISHRLAASSIADHIAVFVDGDIIEYGTHSELIIKAGVYADMYKKQSAYYVV